jgi:hypothetical protein
MRDLAHFYGTGRLLDGAALCPRQIELSTHGLPVATLMRDSSAMPLAGLPRPRVSRLPREPRRLSSPRWTANGSEEEGNARGDPWLTGSARNGPSMGR